MRRETLVSTPRGFLVAAVVALAGTAGCGNADDRLEHADKSLSTWTSTVGMCGRQWADGRVPGVYLRQTLEAATEALDEQASSLKKVPESDLRRKAAEQRLASLRARVEEMTSALGHGDREKVLGSARALATRCAGGPADGGGRS